MVDNAINLKDVVLDSLSFPSENFEKSQKFADFLFGDLRDGKASERIAKHIVNYINLN